MSFNLNFTEEQQQLVTTAREFAKAEIIPVAAKLDEHGTFPKEIIKHAWELGLMNAEVPDA
jgi:acyl-CoA dehydrogenase